MKILPENTYLCGLVLAAILSACLNSLFPLAEWYAVSPHGSDVALMGRFFVGFLMFPLLCAVLAVAISLLLLIPKRIRSYALHLALIASTYSALGVASLWLSNHVRTHAFRELAERSAPLVDEIRNFEAEHARPPSQLEELVPEYLPKIPTTGMGAYPEYKYLVGKEALQYHGNPWVLIVHTPTGILNWDMFMYFPNGKYPDVGYGGWLERIDSWAYVHE